MKNIFYTLLIITGVFLSGSMHAMKRNASHLDTNTENQPQEAPWLPGEVVDHIAGYCEPVEKDLLMKACKHFNARLKNKESIMLANPSTVTLSHKIKKMFEYTSSGDATKLSIWLSTLNNEDVNEYNDEGFTPLHITSQNGNDKIAKLLINAGANANQEDNKNDYTPLHYASENGHTNIIRLLLTLDEIYINGHSVDHNPLHCATTNGHTEAVQLLLIVDEIDLNEKNYEANTPLHIASINGDTKIMQLLLKAGANVNYTDSSGYSALHVALEFNKDPQIETIKLLIDYGADIYKKKYDSDIDTPLKIAQKKGLTEIVKLILDTHEKNIVNSFLNF